MSRLRQVGGWVRRVNARWAVSGPVNSAIILLVLGAAFGALIVGDTVRATLFALIGGQLATFRWVRHLAGHVETLEQRVRSLEGDRWTAKHGSQK